MDPMFLARRVVRGIRENRLYIVGDGAEVREHLQARVDRMFADIEKAVGDQP
jgi:hypothetical protein